MSRAPRWCCWLLALVAGYGEPSEELQKFPKNKALKHLKSRLKEWNRTSRYVVAMIVDDTQHDVKGYAEEFTIPLWEEYCAQHKYDFVVQEGSLAGETHASWSKPILVDAIFGAKKGWHYAWVVDPNTAPILFSKTLEWVITTYMKKWEKREARPLAWCPQECDEEYKDKMTGCYGPFESGCIFRKSESISRMMHVWWGFREKHLGSKHPERGLRKSLDKDVRLHTFWNKVYFDDAQEWIGKPLSKFVPTFSYTTQHKWDVKAMLTDLLAERPELGKIVNNAHKRREADEFKKRRSNSTHTEL